MKHYKLISLVIVINIICFFIPHEYYQYLTVQSNGTDPLLTILQCFTYIFMSENLIHLFTNTLFLICMARIIYISISDFLFAVYYILWGVLIGVINYILTTNGDYHYLIGNSGVIYGFLGYLMVLVPNIEVELIGSLKINFYTFCLVILSLSIIDIAIGRNVYGNIAHLSGFVLGLTTAKIYNKIQLW
jgi:membrane associated rhomboid family serine protease